jgi:isopenicillin-N epimerase
MSAVIESREQLGKGSLEKHWLLDPAITHLNHGSFGACPRKIFELHSEWRLRMERDPLDFLWRHLDGPLDASRARVAELLRAPVEELAFVPNATSAVNAVLRSLEFAPGDELLTTSHGYNACVNVMREVARTSGAKVVIAPVPFPISSQREIVDAVLAHVTPRTKLALIDHITSPTAIIFPVAEIVAALNERGVDTLVDGAHAPGMIPLDLPAIGAAYYTGNLHKWICAPRGTAFLYAREDRQEGLQPPTISHGTNTRRPDRSAFHDRFDWQGTLDVTGWLCAGDAARWCANLLPGGHEELMRRNHDLAISARRLLCERLGIEAPCPEDMLGSMATLQLPTGFPHREPERFDPDQTWLLEEHRFEVPFMRWDGRRWFRVCSHAYNDLEDYAHLAEALRLRV